MAECFRPTVALKQSATLAKAGFEEIGIDVTREYDIDDARAFLAGEGIDVAALAERIDGTFVSAFVRAGKPAAAACCGPNCCS